LKIKDLIKIINEAPLPDGGDDFAEDHKSFNKEIFNAQSTYLKKAKYVQKYADKVGQGSSRSAFEIMYKGRPTVLKVAHNNIGAAQNAVEAKVLNSSLAKKTGLIIPIIDNDLATPPAWIHMEYAELATEEELCDAMKCGTLAYLVYAMLPAVEETDETYDDVVDEMRKEFKNYTDADMVTFKKYVDLLTSLVKHYDLLADDFTRYENWGFYKGKPVIIDIGFTNNIQINYYAKVSKT